MPYHVKIMQASINMLPRLLEQQKTDLLIIQLLLISRLINTGYYRHESTIQGTNRKGGISEH